MIDIVSLYITLSELSDVEQQLQITKLKETHLTEALQLEKMLRVDDDIISSTEFVTKQLSRSSSIKWQDFVGQEVMGFKIKKILSESGGMGFVFHAEQKIYSPNKTFNEVHKSAIKILRTDKLNTQQQKEMFFSEASNLMSLDHPNVCSIYGVSEVLNHACIVMDYIDGQQLDSWLAENDHHAQKKMHIFKQLLNAISYLHKLQVFHGDLKPQNIIVNELDHLIVIDLGLARKFQQHKDNEKYQDLRAFSRNWSAPEQVAGEAHTATCDVYSLGAVLQYLLAANCTTSTGRQPVKDKELNALVKKAMAEDPQDRYQDANEFLLAVGKHQKGFALTEYSTRPFYQLKKLLIRKPFTSLACVLMVYSIICSILLFSG